MTIISFLLSDSFVALAVCFWSLSCWKNHPQLIFSVLAEEKRFLLKILTYVAPFVDPLNSVKSPCTLCKKTAKHNVSSSRLDCGTGVLWVILAFFYPQI